MAKGDGTAPDYDWRFWIEWDSEKDDYVPKGGGSVVAAIFMEIALPIIVLICGVIIFLVWAYNTDRTYESPKDIQWNNGVCAACGTPWHYIDSVGTVNSTRYIYECECGEHRMESCTLR